MLVWPLHLANPLIGRAVVVAKVFLKMRSMSFGMHRKKFGADPVHDRSCAHTAPTLCHVFPGLQRPTSISRRAPVSVSYAAIFSWATPPPAAIRAALWLTRCMGIALSGMMPTRARSRRSESQQAFTVDRLRCASCAARGGAHRASSWATVDLGTTWTVRDPIAEALRCWRSHCPHTPGRGAVGRGLKPASGIGGAGRPARGTQNRGASLRNAPPAKKAQR